MGIYMSILREKIKDIISSHRVNPDIVRFDPIEKTTDKIMNVILDTLSSEIKMYRSSEISDTYMMRAMITECQLLQTKWGLQ